MHPFWSEECSARGGVGLTHTKDKRWLNKCADCGLVEPPASAPTAVAGPEPQQDHLYVSTITGLCARVGCGKPMADHPAVLTKVEPLPHGMCPVSHSGLIAALLIGERGLEWRVCPQCGAPVEQGFETGKPIGNPYGRGRGELTARHRIELEGMAGWWAYNGGDEA